MTNRFQQFILQQNSYYQKWDVLAFALLTLLSILNGQTTIFYLIYFFWWNELTRIVIDRMMYKQNSNAIINDDSKTNLYSSFFVMGIYLIFIVVFFGFIAVINLSEQHIMMNMKAMFFQNWFFNINLIFVLLNRIFLHKTEQSVVVYFGGFTPNMIVIHISIIVSAFLLFFVVNRFPTTFTPENLWGSVLIALPFLLLKMLVAKISK